MPKILILILMITSPLFAFAENEPFFKSLPPLDTLLFIVMILTFATYFFRKFDRFAAQYGSEILTTLGILGCFWGIARGLNNFNSSDINASIPELINGIRTAFFASITGIACALLLKFKQHQFNKKSVSSQDSTTQPNASNELVKAINKLQLSLVGNEEGTLLSQIKLLRQDTNDNLQKLHNSFDRFAAQMAENNQKALIEALNQVIRDFNEKLTEQFGENFKHLNIAVERLVVWQQQYKEELESIKQTQLQTASDMKTATHAFSTLIQNSKEFVTTAGTLKTLLESMDKQINILFAQEKAMNDLLLQMKDITPQFAEKMSKMLQDITTGVRQIQSETVEIVKNFGAQTQSANAEMKNLLTEVIKKSQQQLSDALQENSKIIKEGVLTLDKALQKELNDALTSLGKQLASLSEKFVEDYIPLTDRLREVVRISSNLA